MRDETIQIGARLMGVMCCQEENNIGAFTPLSGNAGIRPGVDAG
jgi:hypothetical protein